MQNIDGGHHIDGGLPGTDTVVVKFPVHLTKPAVSETRVTLDVDRDLVAIYNAVHGTSYIRFEDRYLTVEGATLTIPQGETRSRDSVTVAVARPMKELTNRSGYLIPVKIRNFRGTDVGIDYEKRQSYVSIDVAFENTVQVGGMAMVNTAHTELNGVEFKVNSLYPVQGTDGAKVVIRVNNDLIAEFNAATGSDYQPIAEGLPSSYEMGIGTGETAVTFTLGYTGETSALSDPRGYVVPLEVASVTGENMTAPRSNESVIYAVVYSNGGAYVAEQAEIGVKVTDRTGYSATGAYDNGQAPTGNNMGTPNDIVVAGKMYAIMSPVRPFCFAIDLGAEVENITGFTITNAMGSGNSQPYYIRTMDVSCASEAMQEAGARMEIKKGLDLNATDPVRPKIVNVRFDTPVTARYIYLDNVANVSSYLVTGDFYIFTAE
jgi:hypothetical protein